MKQRSEEWFQARLGIPTASRMSDIMAKTKNGPSASRQNYLAELVIERLTGMPRESFISVPMQWGMDMEPAARAEYEIRNDVMVDEVGFLKFNEEGTYVIGASPDGLVGDYGLIEIKCPNSATHLQTLLSGDIKSEYIWQMQCQMLVAGRSWCDFVSYDPRFPDEYCYFQKRVNRSGDAIGKIIEETCIFIDEIEDAISKLKNVGEK